MNTTRRLFLGLLGSTPLAAKAAADAEIGRLAGAYTTEGLGDASLRLPGGAPPVCGAGTSGANVPYEARIKGAAGFIRSFGLPEVIEFELRDQARYVGHLDPDIACKRAWSMSVKLMKQGARSRLATLLGFEWPW